MAKMVNFGLAYGMSDFGCRAGPGSAAGRAEFITSYFAAYSGISRYMLHIRETAADQGYVATLLGRKRQIPELTSANRALKAAGERMAINMPIQGTAADIVKIAMIRLDAALRDGGFRPRLCSRCTTSCCSRRRATRSTASSPSCARRWRARSRCRAAHRRGEDRRLLGGDGARLAPGRGPRRGRRGAGRA